MNVSKISIAKPKSRNYDYKDPANTLTYRSFSVISAEKQKRR